MQAPRPSRLQIKAAHHHRACAIIIIIHIFDIASLSLSLSLSIYIIYTEVLVQRGVLGPSTCFAVPSRSQSAGAARVLSKWLKKPQKCSKRRKEAQKGARKGCSSLPGAASALEEAVRACFGAACALKVAFRACCSRSLFAKAGLGCTVL